MERVAVADNGGAEALVDNANVGVCRLNDELLASVFENELVPLRDAFTGDIESVKDKTRRDDVVVGVGDIDPMECAEETESVRDVVALNE